MLISEKLKQYISSSKIVCDSNIIITDLENVTLIELLDKDSTQIATNKLLSKDILSIIKNWNSFNLTKSELFCIMNYNCIKLFENDTNNYSAQMIFPLFNKNKLLGLIILFRTNNNYVVTSLKPANSLVHFTNEILNEEN